MAKLRSILGSVFGALAFIASSASAVEVKFAASDLADVTPGHDRWRYNYTLSGELTQFEGVELTFAHELYADLVLDVEPDASAFTAPALLVNPDPGLFANGFLSLSAKRAIDASEAFAFSVSFDWLGTPPPGPHPFEAFDDFFSLTGGGNTTLVPEPSTWLYMFAGVAGLVAIGRRRSSQGEVQPRLSPLIHCH